MTSAIASGISARVWLGVAALVACVVAFAWDTGPAGQLLAGMCIACSVLHASVTYGVRHALVLLAICCSVAFTVENIAAATGWPFGNYHFEVGGDLPRVGRVPLVVGPIWFGMGYLSWIVAGTLLDGAEQRLDTRSDALLLPLVAAIVMTQWDVVVDAPSATIARAWVWHDGGPHLGVPLSNYFGWLLTSGLFFAGFAVYLGRQPEALRRAALQPRAMRLIAILLYVAAGLTHLTPWLMGQHGTVTDASGHAWRIEDIRATTALVMMFTMLFTSLLAAIRLARADR